MGSLPEYFFMCGIGCCGTDYYGDWEWVDYDDFGYIGVDVFEYYLGHEEGMSFEACGDF